MDRKSESKSVRFYFELGIDFVFPENPKKDTLPEEEWIDECCGFLREDIEEKLSPSFDEIQFSHIKQVVPNKNFFTIYFSISECYDFNPNEIWFPQKGHDTFKIKKHPLLKAKKTIEVKIRSSLCNHFFIESLSLEYIASRVFVFDIYFSGSVTVEKKFTPEEIGSSGGVSYALEEFFEEMRSLLQDCGLDGSISQTTTRRNRNHKYVFEVHVARPCAFSEREVEGEISLFKRNMNRDEMEMIFIDMQDDALAAAIADTKSDYESTLGEFVDLLRFDLSFIDYDCDVFDVYDNLLMN